MTTNIAEINDENSLSGELRNGKQYFLIRINLVYLAKIKFFSNKLLMYELKWKL